MSVLVKKKVPRTLFSMALPMLAASFAINSYNLIDTWFIAQLGTLPLAAMGFTFPIVMLLICIGRGIGTGVTTLVSHAIGRHDQQAAAGLVTYGTLLIFIITSLLSGVGYFTINPVFKALGANSTTLPLIGDYMRTWYLGAALTSLPMVAYGTLISTGDSKIVSQLMVVGTLLNLILDPIMIFGYFGCPAMGIRGAALATIIAKMIPTIGLLLVVERKYKLLSWDALRLSPLGDTLRWIFRFAVPSILSLILLPVSSSVITKLLSSFGPETVAAVGVASRIELFAFMIPMALGISIIPFVSQNFGAERLDRIFEAHNVAIRFALIYGGLIAVIFFATANWMAAAFTNDPKVAEALVSYVRIIAFGYGFMEVHRYSGFFLTGLQRPMTATALNGIRVLILLIPCSYLGAHFWGVSGVFAARLITDLLCGLIGLMWVSKMLPRI